MSGIIGARRLGGQGAGRGQGGELGGGAGRAQAAEDFLGAVAGR